MVSKQQKVNGQQQQQQQRTVPQKEVVAANNGVNAGAKAKTNYVPLIVGLGLGVPLIIVTGVLLFRHQKGKK
jgi:hypothetical protein